jgi:transcriptional regulator NrdR family protein
MVKCPKCNTENTKPTKEWNYATFHVEKFDCSKCEAKFREYTKAGEHSFTLVSTNAFGRYQKV